MQVTTADPTIMDSEDAPDNPDIAELEKKYARRKPRKCVEWKA